MAVQATINHSGESRSHWNAGHLLLLLVIVLVCYWPLSFGIFSAKNDNITAFLPTRFHISEALRNGQLPLWTPYMYLGFPLHGDMQGGAWNPVVWMISAFGRYNVSSIHAETMVAIFVAACGMYRLLAAIGMRPATRLAGAAAYAMCGFITDGGGSNLAFVWGAAYAPLTLAYYYHLLKTGSTGYAVKTALVLALFLSSAYPAFLILTGYVMAAALLVTIYLMARHRMPAGHPRRLVVTHLILLVVFAAVAAPVLASYLHVLPYYDRGGGVGLEAAMANSFHPACSASLVMPSLPIKIAATAETDLIMKNAYFNLLFLVLLVPYLWLPRKTLTSFAMAGLVFFFIFSLGHYTPLRAACYQLLPLMDTFRHPANARLFLIIAGIAAACLMYDRLRREEKSRELFAPGLVFLLVLLAVTVIAAFYADIAGLWHSFGARGREGLKESIGNLSLADLAFLNGLAQAIFVLAFLLVLRRRKSVKWLPALIIINSFVLAQSVIPFTLASRLPPGAANTILRSYPAGFPAPDPDETIGSASAKALDHFDTIGVSGLYNKSFNLVAVSYTPTFMKQTEKLIHDSLYFLQTLSNSYAYIASSVESPPGETGKGLAFSTDNDLLRAQTGSGSFEITSLNNNEFVFNVHSSQGSVFCLQQLWLPGWSSTIDGKKLDIHAANLAFMAVELPPGEHELRFRYRPIGVIISLWLSLVTSIAIIFLFIKNRNRKHA